MALTVKTSHQKTKVQVVSKTVVGAKAKKHNPSHAKQKNVTGVTVPIIRVNQKKLRFEQRRAKGGIEFRFSKGPLILTLRQTIYLSKALPACERKTWLTHERSHASDNVALLPKLDGEIRNDAGLKKILIDREWRPRSQFGATQGEIQSAVGAIFRKLTSAAVRKRDTAAEYVRIRKQVRANCGATP